jgi:hypothetical protein
MRDCINFYNKTRLVERGRRGDEERGRLGEREMKRGRGEEISSLPKISC